MRLNLYCELGDHLCEEDFCEAHDWPAEDVEVTPCPDGDCNSDDHHFGLGAHIVPA